MRSTTQKERKTDHGWIAFRWILNVFILLVKIHPNHHDTKCQFHVT